MNFSPGFRQTRRKPGTQSYGAKAERLGQPGCRTGKPRAFAVRARALFSYLGSVQSRLLVSRHGAVQTDFGVEQLVKTASAGVIVLGLAMFVFPLSSAAGSTHAVTQAVAAPVNFFVNGQIATPAGGTFTNQGMTVPDALNLGTTYVPIRLAAELLGASVAWNGAEDGVDITTMSAPSSSSATGALVEPNSMTVTVEVDPIRFFVNHVNRTPAGGYVITGRFAVPDALVFDKTTYVPIQLVASLLHKTVAWNSAYNAVVIGRPPVPAETVVLGAQGGSEASVLAENPPFGEWSVIGGVPTSAEIKSGQDHGLFYGASVSDLACSEKGDLVALLRTQASTTDEVLQWNPTTRNWTALGVTPGFLSNPVFTPSGLLLAVDTPDVYEWEPALSRWTSLGNPGTAVDALTYDPTLSAMVVTTAGGEVYTLDPTSGTWAPLGTPPSGAAGAALAIDPKSGAIATLGGNSTSGPQVSVWLPSQNEWSSLSVQGLPRMWVSSIAFDATGDLFVGATEGYEYSSASGMVYEGGGLYEWNPASGQWIALGGPYNNSNNPPPDVESLTFDPNTGNIAFASEIGGPTVREWDQASGQWSKLPYPGADLPEDGIVQTVGPVYFCPLSH